jgi:CCR4-NOT transcriptional regulation complex NOT5 subunit
MKKEIKKLQVFKNQFRNWSDRPDIKDKSGVNDAKNRIDKVSSIFHVFLISIHKTSFRISNVCVRMKNIPAKPPHHQQAIIIKITQNLHQNKITRNKNFLI